jgi:hypothetical protein
MRMTGGIREGVNVEKDGDGEEDNASLPLSFFRLHPPY